MAGVGAEGEVEQGVEEGGGVHGPLHDADVRLAEGQGQKLADGKHLAELPVGENVVDVEHLEGGPRRLVDEDEEDCDDGLPELRRAELLGAAAADLDQ